MTREEAIEILWRYDVDFEPHPPEEVMHAIDMAIEALNEADKREQYGQNYEADDFVKLGVTDKNKDKVILYDAFGEKEYYPQTDLVRCKDCRHYGSDGGALMVCDVSDMVVDDTDHCSYGERREP